MLEPAGYVGLNPMSTKGRAGCADAAGVWSQGCQEILTRLKNNHRIVVVCFVAGSRRKVLRIATTALWFCFTKTDT